MSDPDVATGHVQELAAEAELEGVKPRLEEGAGPEAGLWSDAWAILRRNPIFIISAVLILLFVVMAIFPRAFTWFYPGDAAVGHCPLSRSSNSPGQGRPSSEAWFGFDIQGCDYYLRTIYGARISIFVGLIVTVGAVAVSLTFGSVAGYYGKWIDTLITRLTDVWFAIPTILGGIVLLSVSSDIPLLGGQRGIKQVSMVLIVLGWPSMLRLMRSSVLSTKEMDYVLASRALGANDRRIVLRHIIPNSIAPVIVYATIFVGVIISAEAALSFLGVGVQLPAISWGLMINTASNRILNTPHLLFFPGVFLSICVFAFIVMGDALRDALDPKLR
jgi:oligopeptide transport system permease protein